MLRKRSKMNIYHVMVRGIDQNLLFFEQADNMKFLELVKKALAEVDVSLYAICVMGNHVHMLVGVNLADGSISIDPLARFMYLVDTAYARYFNKKYQRSGPVFGGRYKSVAVFSGLQFWDTMRYIFHNPVEAGLAKDIFDYPWSSCGQQNVFGVKITLPPEFELAIDFKSYIRQKPTEGVRWLEPNEAISDEKAAELIKRKENIGSTLEIANFPAATQEKVLKRAWAMGISIRRLVRITGLSKGMIQKRLRVGMSA